MLLLPLIELFEFFICFFLLAPLLHYDFACSRPISVSGSTVTLPSLPCYSHRTRTAPIITFGFSFLSSSTSSTSSSSLSLCPFIIFFISFASSPSFAKSALRFSSFLFFVFSHSIARFFLFLHLNSPLISISASDRCRLFVCASRSKFVHRFSSFHVFLAPSVLLLLLFLQISAQHVACMQITQSTPLA